MEKILDQAEIDALFRAARGSAKAVAAPARPVLPFNFRAASQADEQDVRSVTLLQEAFARHLSNSLSAYLRILFQVSLVSAEQLPYGEFLQRVPEMTYVATINISGLDTCLVVQMELGIILPMIDLMLGGRGRPEPEIRELTEIEEHILETILDLFIREACLVWDPYGISLSFGGRQPQSEVVRLMEARDRVLAFGFEIRLPEIRGAFNLAFPAVISNVLRQQRGAPQKLRDRSRSSAHMRDLMLDCDFSVELEVIKLAVSTRKLLELQPGDVLAFRREIDQPVSVLAGGVPLFAAQLARKNASRAALLQGRVANEIGATGKHEARP